MDSEIEARGAWIPHLRAGKTLTEAIELTRGERAGAWNWTTPQLNASYFNVGKAAASGQKSSGSRDAPAGSRGGGGGGNVAANSGSNKSGSAARRRMDSAGPRKKAGRVEQTPGQPAKFSNSGNLFCDAWNKGGCSKGRECKQDPPGLHACNHVDSNARVCGQAMKRRCDHEKGGH